MTFIAWPADLAAHVIPIGIIPFGVLYVKVRLRTGDRKPDDADPASALAVNEGNNKPWFIHYGTGVRAENKMAKAVLN
jgi:hypothetical protein